ncbi:MAG TPA: PDZ domain-containing protein [Terriglobales bacterium]|nr:PDZ domain-containing protein [Terriglobales bacterium]
MRKSVMLTYLALLLLVAIGSAQVAPSAPTPPAPPTAPTAPVAPVAPVRPVPPVPPVPPRSGESSHGSYLGVDTRDVTSDRVGPLKLREEGGVEILMVDQDAPAGKAGLKEHDVILSFNGQKVESVEQLKRVIRETPPGRTVNLGISRDGQPMNISAQLADRAKRAEGHVIYIPRVEIPPMPAMDFDVPNIQVLQYTRRNGLMVENLTPQLGNYFGAKEGHGVLVRSVEQGSPAEAAGFRAGDVIIRVGKERVEDTSDWGRLMRQQTPGAKVSIGIIRDRREQSVSFTTPERKRSDAGSFPVELPADLSPQLEDLQVQLAEIGPEIRKQIELAQQQVHRAVNDPKLRQQIEQAQQEAKREMAAHRKEIQNAHKELLRAQKDVQKASEEIRREVEKAGEEIQRELDQEFYFQYQE